MEANEKEFSEAVLSYIHFFRPQTLGWFRQHIEYENLIPK